MSLRKLLGFVVVLVTMAACSTQTSITSSAPEGVERSYAPQFLTFAAPNNLEMSEDSGYYPTADIVWRGDPRGPRVPQIAAMFETAFDRNKAVLRGDQDVVVDVTLVRFHGVTEQTRFSVGGVYNILFNMTVRDAATGAVIEPARLVEANLQAPGGARAVELDQSGQTEKVRVVDFLTRVFRQELS